jgi:filamentous hemagglutinin
MQERQITQHGSDITADGNLSLLAEANIAVIASQLNAGDKLSLQAGGDLDIASAANEYHYEYHRRGDGKKVDDIKDTVRQQSAVLEGREVSLISGGDLSFISSIINAQDSASLHADGDVALLAAYDSDYSYHRDKKKDFWSRTINKRMDYEARAVENLIETGGDLLIDSGGDQRYQLARLLVGGELVQTSGGRIHFEAVGDQSSTYEEDNDSNAVTRHFSNLSTNSEWLRQSALDVQGKRDIRAANGIVIDLIAPSDTGAIYSVVGEGLSTHTDVSARVQRLRQLSGSSLEEQIEIATLVDPGQSWLLSMQGRDDVDWQHVKSKHEGDGTSSSGPGVVTTVLMAVIVAMAANAAAGEIIGSFAGSGTGTTVGSTAAGNVAVTSGGGGAVGGAGTAAGGSSALAGATTLTVPTTIGGTTYAAGTSFAAGWVNAAASAGIAGMSSSAAVQGITTGKVDWEQAAKTGLVSALTVGLSSYGFEALGGESLNQLASIDTSLHVGSTEIGLTFTQSSGGLAASLSQPLAIAGRGVIAAGLSSAIQKTNFREGFINSVVNDYAALSANSIGMAWGDGQNPVMQTLAHTVLGGAAARLTGNDPVAGALGGFTESVIDNTLGEYLRREKRQPDPLLYTLGTMLVSGVVAEGLGLEANTAMQAAQNAAVNNYLDDFKKDKESVQFEKELAESKRLGEDPTPIYEKYLAISNKNSQELREACTGGGASCVQREELIRAYSYEAGKNLKDPDAIAVTQFLNSVDLQFLHENITTTDQLLFGVVDNLPFSLLGIGLAGRNLAVNTEQAAISAALFTGTNAAFQYFLTGEVSLSDLITAGVIGAAFANPTAIAGTLPRGAGTAEVANNASQTLSNLGYTPNGISHIFHDKHLLNPLLNQFGSQESALLAMQRTAQQTISAGTYQTGSWVSIQVGGVPVAVKGAFINGTFRISTATMRPF